MTVMHAARSRFRGILEGDSCIHPASVHDPISARIAEDLGFEAGMFAGSVASLTVLGAPDAILLTLSEFAAQARRICRASDIALMCDADHGYGNALNVMRTVEELENAGVAGLSIEDTDLPARFGSPDKATLTSVEEGAAKVAAAVAARQDPGLVIAGRTSAAMMTDAADAARRLAAYEAAGADALFAVGVKSWDDLKVVSEATSLPLIIGGMPAAMLDRDELARHRVRVALQGHQPFAAAVKAIHDTLKALREGTGPADLEGVASADLMKQVKRDGDHGDAVDRFLRKPG
jgi:carboxyvinyl-carboxyphosphonate phosphorylmutase